MATRESGLEGFPFFARGDPVQPFQGGLVAWRDPLRVEAWIRETLLLENEVLSVDLSSWVSTKSLCTSRNRWKVGAEVVLRPPAGGFDGCGNHGMGSVVAGQGGWLEAYIIKLVAATVATEDVRCQYHKASLIGTPVTPPSCNTSRNTRVG